MSPAAEKEIVKCRCGHIMRQIRWRDHWVSCRNAGGVEVTPRDIENLEANERRLQGE